MQHARTFSSILAFVALLTSAAAHGAETVVVSTRYLDVFVDLDHCDQAGSVLCGGSGSFGAAADGNDSVVAVIVHVKGPLGGPIGGLLESDFALSSIMSPAPGFTPAFVDTLTCPACFAEQQPGVYRLAARPVAGDWGAGTYMVLLEVTGPTGATAQTVIPLDIPL